MRPKVIWNEHELQIAISTNDVQQMMFFKFLDWLSFFEMI